MTQPRIRQKKPYTDWMLYDSKTDKMKIKAAANQREAIKKALRLGVVPRQTHDVRPMQGGYSIDLMSETEFRKFMDKIEK